MMYCSTHSAPTLLQYTTAHTAQTQHTNKTHNTAQFTTRVLSRWAPVYTVRTVVTTTVRRRAPYGTVIKQPHPLQQEVFTKQILQHPTTVLFLLLHQLLYSQLLQQEVVVVVVGYYQLNPTPPFVLFSLYSTRYCSTTSTVRTVVLLVRTVVVLPQYYCYYCTVQLLASKKIGRSLRFLPLNNILSGGYINSHETNAMHIIIQLKLIVIVCY